MTKEAIQYLDQFIDMEVEVERKPDDLFNFDFTGTCIGVREGLLQVRDQEDNVWEVDADQVALA